MSKLITKIVKLPTILREIPNFLRTRIREFANLLCPQRCFGCDDFIDSDISFCKRCETLVTLPIADACPRCGGKRKGTGNVCGRCRNVTFVFERIITLGVYDGLLRLLILRMKNDRAGILSASVTKLLFVKREQQLQSLQADIIIPVPMHRARRFWRGVNSPDTIADELAAQLRIPALPSLIVRSKYTKPQRALTPSQRKSNLKNAFTFRKRNSESAVRNKRVIVVDDIVTTGATLNAMSQLLLNAGAVSIVVVAIGRAAGTTGKTRI
ncbi:MAG: double zinc ribbon domain-containing protein [Planctomycetaceae bacterium]|jgi:ComF family protein|nr:double zinc ribbon domain-containing protein [Planctomycetaceae bacterium]